jgi:NAD-dependent dihydropyrimidine dehydrogenase PreA subunit
MSTTNQNVRPEGRRRKSLRDIIEINKELCDGCGQCLPACSEGALIIKNGRVVLREESFCDGLGSCIGRCPNGALTVTRRFSDDFISPEQTTDPQNHGQIEKDNLADQLKHESLSDDNKLDVSYNSSFDDDQYLSQMQALGDLQITGNINDEPYFNELLKALEQTDTSWPLSDLDDLPKYYKPKTKEESDFEINDQNIVLPGEKRSLVTWPIQLALVPPKSTIFNTSTVVISADCVAFASPYFHKIFLNQNNPLVIGCPKLDDYELYIAKLGVILRDNPHISEVQLPIMDVPCCRGLWRLAREALKRSKRQEVKLLGWIFSPSGRPLESSVNLLLDYGD